MAWLESAERQDLELEGKRLVAWSWGEGPTVLLVHGWEGRGSQMAAFAAPLAEAGFRAVAFDAPGHGASSGRTSSLPEFAAAVIAVADRFGPVHGAIGHSFGASSTGWALKLGLEVERLVYVAAAYEMTEYVRYFTDLLGLTGRSHEVMVELMERRTGAPWSQAAFSTTIAADDTPLLIVHDHEDRELPLRDAHAIAAKWPDSRVLETRGLGHNRLLRDSIIVQRVVAFLAG